MSEELLVKQCSPTLAGLKTGNLFSCPAEEYGALCRKIRQMNVRLVPRGIRILPLRCRDGRALIYMYRPKYLQRDLSLSLAQEILQSKEYPVENAPRCIAELIRRLQMKDKFPHEIGLFLGYPPEDVKGFIENEAQSAKCVGTWKVYGDEESAKRKFAQYQSCSRLYWSCFCKTRSLESLIVANQ